MGVAKPSAATTSTKAVKSFGKSGFNLDVGCVRAAAVAQRKMQCAGTVVGRSQEGGRGP